MTDLRKAAQGVLDCWDSPKWGAAPPDLPGDLMEALRAALAEEALQRLTNVHQEIEAALEQQAEPVAWISALLGIVTTQDMSHTVSWAPLYTIPPQRKPLTDAEIAAIVREAAKGSAIKRDGSTSERIARAVEAKLKEKKYENNT